MTLSRSLQHRLEALVVLRIDRQRYVHVRSAEWIFPVGGNVIPNVIQNGRARRHALTEFLGETIQRWVRHPKCLETLIAECDAQPPGETWYPPVICGRHVWDEAAQHFASLRGVIHAKDHVLSFIRRRTWAQDRRLYVAHFECGNVRYRHDDTNLRIRFIALGLVVFLRSR